MSTKDTFLPLLLASDDMRIAHGSHVQTPDGWSGTVIDLEVRGEDLWCYVEDDAITRCVWFSAYKLQKVRP